MKSFKISALVICIAIIMSCFVITSSAADSDFVIENGVLKEYKGKGGDIVIPEGVTEIESWIFHEDEIPTTIFIPASVKYIDGRAFASCTALTDIDVDPKNTFFTSIDGIMYNYDKTVLEQYPAGKNIAKYIVPDHVTTIGDYSMYGNDDLTEIIFHDKVATIQEGAFEYCTKLNNVTLPDGLTYLGAHIFSHCTNLSNITLPETIKTIDYDVFSNCSSLKSFTVPKNVKNLDSRSFLCCDNLIELKVHPENEHYVSIDNVIFTKDMKSLVCFPGGKGGKYIIPEGTANIEGYSFSYNKNITEIIFPDSIIKIDYHAFDGIEKIKKLTVPKVDKIPNSAFSHCKILEEIIFSNGIKTIDEYAFYSSPAIESIVLPYSLTSIGNKAFADCAALTDITIYDNVTEISPSAFRNSDNLTIHCYKGSVAEQYAINNKIKYKSTEKPDFLVYNSILYDYNGTGTDITIPSSVKTIAENTFAGCNTVKNITVPNTVAEISPNAFSECTSLESINLPNTITAINEGVFRDCTSLTSIVVPDSVTTIDAYAFWGCTSLSSISIPDSVTYIGNRAFRNCTALREVSLPDSITHIDGYIFTNCPDITVLCNEGTYAWQYAVDNGLIEPPITTTLAPVTTTLVPATVTPPVETEAPITETEVITESSVLNTEVFTETVSESTVITIDAIPEITKVPETSEAPILDSTSIIPDLLCAILIPLATAIVGAIVLFVLNRKGIIELVKKKESCVEKDSTCENTENAESKNE